MRIDVDADDAVPQLRQAGGCDGTDVSETDDDDVHPRSVLSSRTGRSDTSGTRTYPRLHWQRSTASGAVRPGQASGADPCAGVAMNVTSRDALARVEWTATISRGSAPVASRAVAVCRDSEGNEIDIALYADVLRRHRTVVFVGVVVDAGVGGVVRRSDLPVGDRLSLARRSGRTSRRSSSRRREHLSCGRCFRPAPAGGFTSSLADTSRFAGLIDVYTTLATSDAVVRVLERRGLSSSQRPERQESSDHRGRGRVHGRTAERRR